METSEGSSSIGNISAVYNNEIYTNNVDSDVESCANDYEVSYNIPLYDFDHFDDIYTSSSSESVYNDDDKELLPEAEEKESLHEKDSSDGKMRK